MDIHSMSDQDLAAMQQRISFEQQKRYADSRSQQEQKGKDYLASSEAQRLKSEIMGLEAEFALLPKKIDLNQKLVLNLFAQMDMVESVREIIENGDDPSGLILEAEPNSIPEGVKYAVENMLEELNCEYNPAKEFLNNSFEGRQWLEFLQKVDGLEPKLQGLYDSGLDLDDLMEE